MIEFAALVLFLAIGFVGYTCGYDDGLRDGGPGA